MSETEIHGAFTELIRAMFEPATTEPETAVYVKTVTETPDGTEWYGDARLYAISDGRHVIVSAVHKGEGPTEFPAPKDETVMFPCTEEGNADYELSVLCLAIYGGFDGVDHAGMLAKAGITVTEDKPAAE